MSKKGNRQLVRLADVEGFQHGHGDALDDYWYSPLLFGENLFTYVAQIPPGGDMPASEEEAKMFELSLYMLQGTLEIIYGDEEFVIESNMALYIPRGVPFGLRNKGDETACYVLTFYPPPGISSIEALRERFIEKGGNIKSPEEMKKLVGTSLRE